MASESNKRIGETVRREIRKRTWEQERFGGAMSIPGETFEIDQALLVHRVQVARPVWHGVRQPPAGCECFKFLRLSVAHPVL